MKTTVLLSAVLMTTIVGSLAQTNQLGMRRYHSSIPQVSQDLDLMPAKRRVDVLKIRETDYSGLAVKLTRARKGSDIAQLFNPFAPASYGNAAWSSRVAWRPLEGNRPLPHAFIDPVTHEPTGIVVFSTSP